MSVDHATRARLPAHLDQGDVVRCSSHVRLVRLQPHHLPEIHHHLTSSRRSEFWRSRGRYIPSHLLEEFLVGDGHECLVVCSQESIFGLVEIFDVNLIDGHAQLSALTWRTGLASSLTVEALILGMDYWFCSHPLERFFIQVAKTPSQSFRKALDRYFEYCGTLPAYLHVDNTRHDVLIYSMTRERYIELSPTSAYFRGLDVRCPSGVGSTLAEA